MITLDDPFPGSLAIGLEVTPSGPYAVLRRPWSAEAIIPDPPSLGGLLGMPLRVDSFGSPAGIRLTASIHRISRTARWTFEPMGVVHLRGFNDAGRMLWSATFRACEPWQMSFGGVLAATFDLLAPFTIQEYP